MTVSSLITSVLKKLPLRLTGYCGLMLAVCEDQVGPGSWPVGGATHISQLFDHAFTRVLVRH